MFVFQKIWRVLFSWNTHFEIRLITDNLDYTYGPLYIQIQEKLNQRSISFKTAENCWLFHKNLHLRCLAGFWKRFWQERLETELQYICFCTKNYLNVIGYLLATQWIHLHQFAFDSTSKFHVENRSISHRLWKGNPREKMTSKTSMAWLDFQNRWNNDGLSTCFCLCFFRVYLM